MQQKNKLGTSLVVLVKDYAFTAEGTDSILGRGIGIPQAMRFNQKEKETERDMLIKKFSSGNFSSLPQCQAHISQYGTVILGQEVPE